MKSIFAIILILLSFNALADNQTKAEDIYAEYNRNSVAADMKYKNKKIVLSGIISDIGTDVMGDAYIVIGKTELLTGVQCLFKRKASVVPLAKGDTVLLSGIVSGFMVLVQVHNSKILKVEKQ